MVNQIIARPENRPAAEIYLQPQPVLQIQPIPHPNPLPLINRPPQINPQPAMIYPNPAPIMVPILQPSIGVPAGNYGPAWNQNVVPGEPMGIPIYAVNPAVDPEFPDVDPSAAVPEINASAQPRPTQIVINTRPLAPAGGEDV